MAAPVCIRMPAAPRHSGRALKQRMKTARSVLIACIVVLVIAGAWYALARIASLEGRVKQLEATCARLQSAHRTLLEELLHGSPEEQARAKVAVARELAGMPQPAPVTLMPATTERNLPPTAPRSR
jgi:hypothetical protein